MDAFTTGLTEGALNAAPYILAALIGLYAERRRKVKAMRRYEQQRRQYTKKRLEQVRRCEI